MLCPESFGTATITNTQVYDTYQWQFKFFMSDDPFQDIDGADESSFTYDHFNFSATHMRVKVTLGGQTYFSNEIFVDGWAFGSIFTMLSFNEDEVSTDPNDGTLLLCNGATIQFTVGMPYVTNVQWYKNGVAINGANSPTLIVGSAGTYHVSGSPQECPDFVRTALPTTVADNPNCDLAVSDPSTETTFSFSPNPAKSNIRFNSDATVNAIDIIDVNGKKLISERPSALQGNLDLSSLPTGIYFLKSTSAKGSKTMKLVKE